MDTDDYSPYEDTSQASKLKKLVVDYPMLPVGVTAFVAIVGHGLYNFKKRTIRPSLYLIHYRVAAQGTFLGCLTLGLAYTLFKRHVWDKVNKDKKDG